jgi:hypothetical protein
MEPVIKTMGALVALTATDSVAVGRDQRGNDH